MPSVLLTPRSFPDQAVHVFLRAARNERDFRLRSRDESLLARLPEAQRIPRHTLDHRGYHTAGEDDVRMAIGRVGI
jgi:hypothetical protein